MLECSVSNLLVYQYMRYAGNREQWGFDTVKISINEVLYFDTLLQCKNFLVTKYKYQICY